VFRAQADLATTGNALSPMARRADFIPIETTTLVETYWEQERPLPEMAQELGLGLRTVHTRMIEAGLPRRRLGRRPAHGDQVQRPAGVLTARYLVANYQRKGMTLRQIAAETGFGRETVSYYLRRAGIPRPVGFVTQYHIDRKQPSKLSRQSVSTKEIAAKYGCSVSTSRASPATVRAHGGVIVGAPRDTRGAGLPGRPCATTTAAASARCHEVGRCLS
jgi:DNA-binding CsgD family transcriptional regulator